MNPETEIGKFFKGEVLTDEVSLEKYSRDASIFKVRPRLVVFPKDAEDLKNLTIWVKENPDYSITVRGAGSDMTGGPLGESIVADLSRHMNKIGEIEKARGDNSASIILEPGAFYRDLEKRTLDENMVLPCFPASKSLCALGGMIGNNCGGERSLRYGQMENFLLESKTILADGKEYVIKPLNKEALESKKNQDNFEGEVYRKLDTLIEENKELIKQAQPRVSKNSAGYYLWNIWQKNRDGEEVFDLNRLLVGSQGTLGIITEAKIKLVKENLHHDMVALFFKTWDELPQVVKALTPLEPESLETFDEETLKLALCFMPEIARKSGSSLPAFILKFLPETLIGLEMLGLPKLIILVEVAEDSEEKVKAKVEKVLEAIEPFKIWHRVIEKDSEENKFWTIRRESFNLLRKNVGRKKAVSFVEDFCVPVECVPEFLPQALRILKTNGIKANIAGHAGNGNFHIIPLMDMSLETNRKKIVKTANEFYDLVRRFNGSTTGEHSDGILRTPYLEKMYDQQTLELFKKTKEIFDPTNIFNPGKKIPSTNPAQAGGTLEYLESHIAIE